MSAGRYNILYDVYFYTRSVYYFDWMLKKIWRDILCKFRKTLKQRGDTVMHFVYSLCVIVKIDGLFSNDISFCCSSLLNSVFFFTFRHFVAV